MLFERHQRGASGHEIVDGYTGAMDHLLRSLFDAANAAYVERFSRLDQRCTVVAQGGYGRAELNPCSDIDLLFLYPYKRDPYIEIRQRAHPLHPVGHAAHRRQRHAQRARVREARGAGLQGQDGVARRPLPVRR